MTNPFFETTRPALLRASLTLLVVALVCGGSSRVDVPGPIVVRIVAVGVLLWALWQARAFELRLPRGGFLFWFVALALPLIQLIPLPWSIWTLLPGRELARDVYESMGVHPWLPISLVPDRTINAGLALLPPFAAWVLGTQLDPKGRESLINAVFALTIISALLGLLQVASGAGSLFYLYALTNDGLSVGVFANSNHQALLLCYGIVLACLWLSQSIARRPRSSAIPTTQLNIAGATILLMLTSIYFTDSRGGILMSMVALAFGLTFVPWKKIGIKRKIFLPVLGVAAIALCIFAMLLLTGQLAGDKFFNSQEAELRITLIPLLTRMSVAFFPFGSGLGSFEQVFMSYETPDILDPSYLNNAHNELAQLAIEGGLIAIILVVFFLVAFFARALPLWLSSAKESNAQPANLQKAATLLIALPVVHSLADYPLRTSALAVLFAFAWTAMMEEGETHGRRRRQRADA